MHQFKSFISIYYEVNIALIYISCQVIEYKINVEYIVIVKDTPSSLYKDSFYNAINNIYKNIKYSPIY